MNISKIAGVRMEAIAACVPTNKICNSEYAKTHFPEAMEPTLKALGIKERRVAVMEDSTSMDMCVTAAKRIFDDGIVKRGEIGAIVYVTLTPDFLMPNNSTYAQHLLDLPQDVAAFDVNHACPGYVYGLWNAALIAQNIKRKVLLLDGDINSKYVSPFDKNTSLLFGDAGTATIVAPDTSAVAWHFTFMSDGSKRDSIVMRLGMRNPIRKDYLDYKPLPDGSMRRFIDMEMDGRAVFDYVVDAVPELANAFMEELEMSGEEYDKLLLHQANLFMLKKLAKAIGFDFRTQVPVSINHYGNASSASIPLTISSELKEPSGRCLMIGMGAGLSSGVADVSLEGLVNYGVIEIKM